MEKKIIQIIPCQPNTKVMHEIRDEEGSPIPAMNEDGQVLVGDDGAPVYEAVTTDAHCLALVEDPDGSRYVEPVISMGEYLDLAEHYIAVYIEEAHQ